MSREDLEQFLTDEGRAKVEAFMAEAMAEETAWLCTTACDADCDADCHESHQVIWKRQHQPENCPATTNLGVASSEVVATNEPPMTGSSGDEAAQTLATFLDGMPTPKERLNAAIRALLDERGQCHAGTNLGAGSSQMGPGDEAAGRTAVAWEVDAYATRYSAYASGRSDADPGWPPVEAMHTVVAELVAATARAKQAEAEVERLKDVALHAIDTEKQLLRESIADELNRAAELGYPHNAAWNQDLHQAAHIARDGLEAWFADEGRGPDGKRLDGRRQPWEPIRDQRDVNDLAAAEEDRLGHEEFASFQAAIAECRGEEEGSNHGDA